MYSQCAPRCRTLHLIVPYDVFMTALGTCPGCPGTYQKPHVKGSIMNKQIKSYLWLALGSALLIVVGWRWNAPIAAWLAPVFFIRFFRTQKS